MRKFCSFILLALLVTISFILTSKIQAASSLQSMIKYYVKNDGANFIRSNSPFTGIESQTNNPDGSVTVDINSAPGYADSGFVIYYGKLGDLTNFTLNGSGNQFGMNLWFDVDKNGEFFSWSSTILSGLGADTYGLGPQSISGNLTVDGSSPFYMMTSNYGVYTLNQLKAGLFPGIDSETPIAIWVGINVGGGSKSTIINGYLLSNKKQCINNNWRTFVPLFKNQGDCVSYVKSNANAIGNK